MKKVLIPCPDNIPGCAVAHYKMIKEEVEMSQCQCSTNSCAWCKHREQLELMIEEGAKNYISIHEYEALGVHIVEASEFDFKGGAKSMVPLIENLQRQNKIMRDALCWYSVCADEIVLEYHNGPKKVKSTEAKAALTQADAIAKELESK